MKRAPPRRSVIPGIATVYALEEFDGQMFIAGEFVPGETLREEIARGPLSVLGRDRDARWRSRARSRPRTIAASSTAISSRRT